MSGFIEWLERVNENNTKARAVLRRSLAFDPGAFVSAYPYLEPFLKGEDKSLRREVHYLVAGLWAAHWREGRSGAPMAIGKACQALYLAKDMSPSIERRFITLLDADRDQLPNRLRQVISLLKDYPIDFEDLLTGLLYWNDDRKRIQNAWARKFYRNTEDETEPKPTVQEEQAL
jgi:CRISPR system Cascade subunit CasB